MQTKRNKLEEKCAWMRARQEKKRRRYPALYSDPPSAPQLPKPVGVCGRCGKSFEPALRPDGKRVRASYCAACIRPAGRPFGYGRSCQILSHDDAVYIAGFFDGEGCACLHRRSRGKSPSIQGIVSIVNANTDVLKWIAAVTGLGSVNRLRRDGTNARDCAVWTTQASGAVSFLEQLTPYLRVKREVVKLFSQSLNLRLTNPELYRCRDWQDGILLECRRLNRRGREQHIRRLRKRLAS